MESIVDYSCTSSEDEAEVSVEKESDLEEVKKTKTISEVLFAADMSINVAGIFNFPGFLCDDQAVQWLLHHMERKIGQVFHGCDAMFLALHESLVAPESYNVKMVRQHLCNYMKLFRDELEEMLLDNLSSRGLRYESFVERLRTRKTCGMEIACLVLAHMYRCKIAVIHPAFLWISGPVKEVGDLDIVIGLNSDHSVYCTVGGRLLDVLHLDVLLQSPNSIMETMPYKLSRRKFKPAYNSADEEIDQFERTLPVRRNFKPAKLFPVDYVSVNNEEDAAIVYGTNNVSSSDEDVGLLHRSDMSDRSSADSPLFKEDSADGLSYEPLSPILTLSDIPAAKAVSDPNATQVLHENPSTQYLTLTAVQPSTSMLPGTQDADSVVATQEISVVEEVAVPGQISSSQVIYFDDTNEENSVASSQRSSVQVLDENGFPMGSLLVDLDVSEESEFQRPTGDNILSTPSHPHDLSLQNSTAPSTSATFGEQLIRSIGKEEQESGGRSNSSEPDIIFISEQRGGGVEKDQASSDESVAPDLKKWQCESCHYQATSVDTYNIHIKFCGTTQKRYPCRFPGCEQLFKSRSLARIHFRTVHQEDKVVCNTDGCQATFTRLASRKEHIRRCHLKEVRFRCDQCPAAFFNKRQFELHMLKHSNIKPYMCGVCRKASFCSANDLTRHIDICGAFRQFQCEQCGQSFKTDKYLRQHVRAVHQKECLHQCDECPKFYLHAASLWHHKKNKHNPKSQGDDQC